MKTTENGKRKTENPGADRPREKCGVFGVYGHPDAARLTYFGLYALQHRGQESCGIVTGDGCRLIPHRGLGLGPGAFNPPLPRAPADAVMAARAPRGFRPLSLGALNGSWVTASETCAFDLVQADYFRE